MTLLVAGINDGVLWMVADTFITGGTLAARAYEHEMKLVASDDDAAIIGFAGDHYNGTRTLEVARRMPTGNAVVDYLLSVSRNYPVDFAYGYRHDTDLHLIKISRSEVMRAPSLYLGHPGAFEQFQAIRHRADIDPPPKAIRTFIFATASKDRPPTALSKSTVAMIGLFFERSERDVGGAAIPYMLGPNGVFLCQYAFGVTDPVTDRLRRGDTVPHGSANEGGFALSVTSFNRHQGIVVYWLQKPGGIIFLRAEEGVRQIEIAGSPSQFKEDARKFDLDAELFFGEEQNTGSPDGLSILHGEDGKPVLSVARYGRNLQFSVIDTSADFRTIPAALDLTGEQPLRCSVAQATVADDRCSAVVEYLDGEEAGQKATYSGKQLDELITILLTARARLAEPLPVDPREGRNVFGVALDPMWRTEIAPPPFNGLLLHLRHNGAGWLSFLLPHHEAIALAEWLSQNAQR
jgi:hypothetical protein